jgi:L-idonate 5-dehydrogenase
MRALFIHAPRDLRIENAATPALGHGDVLVRMEAGGICGSDLHYYQHGGFGTVRLREPMVLGHEIAGIVEAIGDGVSKVAIGQRVAVNPSRPCGACRYCQTGQQNHCLHMLFYGSAMRFPHVQGGFRDHLVIEERQAEPVAEGVSAAEAAFAEPLAVCLHGVRRAGSLLGKRVLITGCGPIGALAIIAARRAGALEIVVTDVTDRALAIGLKVGANGAHNTASAPDALAAYGVDKGTFDVLLEASGNNRALVGAFEALRPGAIIVQLGLGGEFTLPINTLVAKEFDLRGTFRFHEEFGQAVSLIGQKLVDVTPLLSATLPLAQALEAFELAADRSRAMKVQLSFN